jgi:acetolactate synthase I/II/III large subunit
LNGAETLVRTLLASGVNTCFANPGTSEMHFVAALDRVPGMHCVLCLFEGVATGAADGYGRMAEKPAITLLHGGPGLGNGLANLHNARRAQTPVLNVVGDQATHHRPLDPPLTADTEGWARGLSAWTRVVQSVSTIGADAAAAVQAARTAHGQIATLIAPADTCWDDGGIEGTPLPVPPAGQVAPHVIRQIAQVLRSGEPAVLILGGSPIRATMVADAQRIAAATGAKLTAAQFNARVERGRGRHPIPRLPYGIDQAMAVMAGAQHIVLIGTMPPVAPFAYPDKPGYLAPEAATTHVLARPEQDVADALTRLADELGAPDVPAPEHKRLDLPTKAEITQENITQMLAALLPENAVVIDESVSFGRNFFNGLSAAAPHDWLQITGAAIGSGLPMATGAAIAAPGRRVVALQADGSAMYTLQALWTQARERLPITTVLLSNRKYQILLGELTNVGANAGRVALDMMDLGNPDIAWTSLAQGMGVGVLQLTGEGRKLAHITKESVLHCTRAYIGDPHEYKKLQNLRQPYISPKEQSVQQPDGSFLTMPLVESAGEIEFEEIAAAMESLTQRREGTSVGVIAGCVLRIADARQSGELEYLQLHEASLTPWEGHSGFSLFASNSDTRGIGIYYQAGKMGFVFIVGDSECCRKEYAQTAKDFVEMAKKKYDLNLA